MLRFAFGLCALCWSCGRSIAPEEVAAQSAKAYYDLLIQGKFDQFVDGCYRADSIPSSYREQLIANAKMFMGEQHDAHRGIKEVCVVRGTADTARHTVNAFLRFVYGDNTREDVVVPMVERKGVWYMR